MKVLREAVSSKRSDSVRDLGRDVWGEIGNCLPHLGPGSGDSYRVLVAEAGPDMPGRVEHYGADSGSIRTDALQPIMCPSVPEYYFPLHVLKKKNNL